MHGLFSKRFAKALEQNSIPPPSFPRVLRKRLAMVCRDHSEEWRDFGTRDTRDATLDELQKAYGADRLGVQDDKNGGDRAAENFEDFLVFAYPHCVIDALEAFYRLLSQGDRNFEAEINSVLQEENSPWRFTDGRAYMVDSRFLDGLKDLAEEEMKRVGFLGAHEEFTDARSHLLAGETDDAVHKASRAFESALKSLLNQREGTAGDLIARLQGETDLLKGVPKEARRAVSKVLHSLPILRHKLGGHGQGMEPIAVPRPYGELAVNLSAGLVKFLLDLKEELEPAPEEGADALTDDDIPF